LAVRVSGTVGNVTSHTLPSRITAAHVIGSITLTVTRAINAVQTRAARYIAQWSTIATEEVAHAFSIHNLTITRALSVATVTSPARITHAVDGVLRGFGTVDTRKLTAFTHPPCVTVNTTWVPEINATHTSVVAIRFTRAVGSSTVVPSPADVAHTLMEVSVTCTIIVASAVWSRAGRYLTIRSEPRLVTVTSTICASATVGALHVTEVAVEAVVTNTAVSNAITSTRALLITKLT
jgi:hypothetical protein